MDIKIDEKWFYLIQSGKKTVEGRLNRGVYKELKQGNYIRFVCNGGATCDATIVDIRHYKSFEEYLVNETLNNTLPSVETFEQGLAIYHQFYTREDVAKFGVLAIEIKI